MRQLTFDDLPFGGETVTAADVPRLRRQLDDVRRAMADGRWHTPEELEAATGHRWASISARIRDLRKVIHGGHTVLRESRGNGLFVYRFVPPGGATTPQGG